MNILARGQENNTSILNWFLSVSGAPFNAYEVGFRILDQTEGSPGTQVFPAVAGTYEPVTNAPGRFGAGAYFAYNNTASTGWTPSLSAPLGQYEIEWRWKDDSSSSYLFGSELFTVTSSIAAVEPLYIPVSAVRAEGIPNPPTDAAIEDAIRTWQSFVERACRQWFYPKTLEFYLDGTDSDAIHFGVPIIGIEEIRINNSATALDPSLYRVYNSNELNDRKNPRIKLVNNAAYEADIFSAPDRFSRFKFRHGRQNQYIKGTFGYVEHDGSVPRLIQRAVLKLVIEKISTPLYIPADSDPIAPPPIMSGTLLEEWTDGHRRRYGAAGGETKPRSAGLLGITNDPEVLRILTLYRAPIGVATPNNPTYR